MKGTVFLHNIRVTVFFLTDATLLASAFFLLSHNSANVAIIYVLATVFVARNTAGYVPGIITAFLSVVFKPYSDGAEFIFTLPLGEYTYEPEIDSSDY
ncbi:MAG: DUF4118 domain-containing protein [Hungatella sp.]|nr:DUF4118 domain-containing protein [Hungatella sp.]